MSLKTRLIALEAVAGMSALGCPACRDRVQRFKIIDGDDPIPPPEVCSACGRELPSGGIRVIHISGCAERDPLN